MLSTEEWSEIGGSVSIWVVVQPRPAGSRQSSSCSRFSHPPILPSSSLTAYFFCHRSLCFHKTGLSFSHQISHTHTRFFHPESSNNDINSSSSSNSQSLNMSAALFTATAPQILIHSLPLPQVKRAGEGSCPGHGAQVRVDYSAWVEGLPGGPVDSSTDRGEALLFPFPTLTLTLTLIRKAVVFCLGKGEVLKGVDQVVSTMQVRRNLPSNPNPTPDPNPD